MTEKELSDILIKNAFYYFNAQNTTFPSIVIDKNDYSDFNIEVLKKELNKNNFDIIDTGVNQLMEVINDFKRVIGDIADASEVISNGATELSANSEEVSALSNEGADVVTQAVEDMNKVKEALTNIYRLAQEIRNEYNVE